jgi:uncharacterized protein (TIGR00375 family)
MQFIADLHIHSRFSRATSKEMNVPGVAAMAKKKGIDLVGTADYTHPQYVEELKRDLKDEGNGLFSHDGVHFILSTELNLLYNYNNRLRRIHQLVFLPSLESAAKLTEWLDVYGKLASDGRPTLSHLTSHDLLAKVLEIEPRGFVVPAHIWTPWFSLFGSNSGFDAIEECFGDLTGEVFAVETGLSSDPAMNWRVSALDRFTLISNSDAHSPNRLGREANVFDTELSFDGLKAALKANDPKKLLYTIEFYPEEGKYHWDGHRACNVACSPEQSLASSDLCPACGRRMTIGVLHRVLQLADRKEDEVPKGRVPFRSVVPLEEVIAEAQGVGRDTAGVGRIYDALVAALGSEFHILLDAPVKEIEKHSNDRIALGVERMRSGEVTKIAGYDGEFGHIHVLPDTVAQPTMARDAEPGTQMGLFG